MGSSQQIGPVKPDRSPVYLETGHAAAHTAGWNAPAFRFLTVAAAIFILFVLRKPDTLLNPQFWAEDGLIYFSQGLVGGPASIFSPYNACLWILPRIVALAAMLLPVLWAPFAFNLIALAVDAGCCALFSLPAYRHLVSSDWLRIGCCVLFATALSTGEEMIGTLTNMPWYLALAAVGAVALRPESVAKMRDRNVLWIAGGAALCATSSPVVLAVAPLALWQACRAIGYRNWKMLAISAALLVGILIQGFVDFTLLNRAGSPAAPLLPNLPMALLFPGVLRWTLGERIAQFLAARFLWLTGIAASLVMVAWLAVLFRRVRVSFLLSALLLIVCPIAMSITGRHMLWATWTGVLEWGGYRYFLLPGCAFIVLAAAWIDTYPRFRLSLVALLLPFLLGIAGNFRVQPYPNFNWPSEAHLVRHWLATGCEVSIPVPPGRPWVIQLPNLAPPQDSSCGPSAEFPSKTVASAEISTNGSTKPENLSLYPFPTASLTPLWLPGDRPPRPSQAQMQVSRHWIEVKPTAEDPQLLFNIGPGLGRYHTLIVRARFQKADRIDAFFGKQVDGRGVSAIVPMTNKWLDVYLNISQNPFWHAEHGATLRFDPVSSFGPGTTAYIAGIWGSTRAAPPAWPDVQFYPVPPSEVPDVPTR